MNHKGSALVLTVGVVAIMTALCAGYSIRIFNEAAIAQKNVHATKAFWVSEAGIQKAAWDYTSHQCQGMKNASTGVACTNCVVCGLGPRIFTGTLASGDFSVVIDPDTKTYVSTGSVWQGSGESKKLLATRKIKMFFGRDLIFGYAAFSQGELTINNGSHIDSYDSGVGMYNATLAGENGNMGTNGSSVSVVDIGNNSIIHGSVSTGPGGTVDYMPSKVSITGGITHTNDVYIEPVSIPSDFDGVNFQGPLVVSGTTTLSSGTYHYDSIAIGNSGTLNIIGDVKIYLSNTATGFTTGNNTAALNISDGASVTIYTDGAVDLGNKVEINNNNINPKPADFVIYSRYAGENGVVIDNNNTFYGAVYAPLTDVELSNNGAMFGSITGKAVEISNNGELHYDQALGSLQALWQPNALRDWQEQAGQ